MASAATVGVCAGSPIKYAGSGAGGCRGEIGKARSDGPASTSSSDNTRCPQLGLFTATPPRANLSREEPDAGNPHVRVCEGWGWQRPHLLGNPTLDQRLVHVSANPHAFFRLGLQ